ncbi:lipoyl synthase [Mycetohabitans sp. B2]|uniref:lipoyl synthase n=1 Tax=Mycetohabitans sp. B2 TaxID=2841274 RepID=UPI001F00E948|nr:lipoyl synthase [Mycetohabitans sp. B2]MCF7697558.1 lipoyl synthase [Mycetohabitans sp. B2]
MGTVTPYRSLTALGQRGARSHDKLARIPVKVVHPDGAPLPKPAWLRARPMMSEAVAHVAAVLREHGLHSVCEEAMCPNIGECFTQRSATFMVMGGICTRRCPFCDVAHGRPPPLDEQEPARLADAAAVLGLRYVVVTSVDRDDLRDGGAEHFARCVQVLRARVPGVGVEILTPDFRGRTHRALDALSISWPDVFNHNIETVPSLYRVARPGADYAGSLALLAQVKMRNPALLTKSGLMLGLGERDDEVMATLRDLRRHGVDIITLGQYLAPSPGHLPVKRYVSPVAFDALRTTAMELGFRQVIAGPLVRSSYHAAQTVQGVERVDAI